MNRVAKSVNTVRVPAGLPARSFVAAVLAAAVCAPLFLGAYGMNVCLQLFSWIALTGSWAAFSGMTGYVSLGHAVFYGLGAYLAALLWQGVPLYAIVPAAGLAAALLALLVGFPALRVRGPYFVILSFGVSELMKYVVVATEAALGSSGRLLVGTPDASQMFYPLLALAVAATAINVWLSRSRFGYGLRAISEDETAAATLGVPTLRYKLLAFALSAVIPGMVGVFAALRSTYFEPMQLFNPLTSFTIVSMAIIGGSQRPSGPVLGACFITLLSELLWAEAPQLYMIIIGLLLVGFVLLAPGGLAGFVHKWSGRRS